MANLTGRTRIDDHGMAKVCFQIRKRAIGYVATAVEPVRGRADCLAVEALDRCQRNGIKRLRTYLQINTWIQATGQLLDGVATTVTVSNRNRRRIDGEIDIRDEVH